MNVHPPVWPMRLLLVLTGLLVLHGIPLAAVGVDAVEGTAPALGAAPTQTSIPVEDASKGKISPVEGASVGEATAEGAWCWFADPRALRVSDPAGRFDVTLVGSIDVHGNIKATQFDHRSNHRSEVLIRSYFQPDDHDNPTFLALPDGRIMVFYSRHTDEACFYYRVTRQAGDLTTLGEEMKIPTRDNTTYPSPFFLTDDPDHFYLCWRGIRWHPTLARLTLPDASDRVRMDWGPFQLVQSTGARPYAKYTSDGKSRIFFSYTTGHPDNELPNYLYFNYFDVNSKLLKDMSGQTLSSVGGAVHRVDKDTYPQQHPAAVVDAPADQRAWVWQACIDADGRPVLAMVRISADKTKHDYYYARWTGDGWQKTFLASGGGAFHQSPGLEQCYSGGMALDESRPSEVYCSVPVKGEGGTVYELVRYTVDAGGKVVSTQAVTQGSNKNNVRPYVLPGSEGSPIRLAWMYGDYYDWMVSAVRPAGYPTSIRFEGAWPADRFPSEEACRFRWNRSKDALAGLKVNGPNTPKAVQGFTLTVVLGQDAASKPGRWFRLGRLEYGLDSLTARPWIRVGDQRFDSSNRLGTADGWREKPRATSGDWWPPKASECLELSLAWSDGRLTVYRNGCVDQTVFVPEMHPEAFDWCPKAPVPEDVRLYSGVPVSGLQALRVIE